MCAYQPRRACRGAFPFLIGLIPIAVRAQAEAPAVPTPEARPGAVAGYLQRICFLTVLPCSPPPPAAGSTAFALDEAASRQSLTLRDTPRWKLAAEDADLSFPHAAGTFACALGAPITERDTPTLYRVLQRSVPDAARRRIDTSVPGRS